MGKKKKRKSTRRNTRASVHESQPQKPKLPDSLIGLSHPPVSGRYYGAMTAPDVGDFELDLRVDIDCSHPHSPVMNRVSGDTHIIFRLDSSEWRVYRESWIIDDPQICWLGSSVNVIGEVRRWTGSAIPRTIVLEIPWTATSLGPAKVTFHEGGNTNSYVCEWRSNLFRKIEMEIDVCQSVNVGPLLPSYETDAHNDRPDGLPKRQLSIVQAYAEAGVEVEIANDHTVIDDSDPEFEHWTPAELHDLMVKHFGGLGSKPRWNLWGVMAGKFKNTGVGGIMFDAAAEFGGAGVPPERQGFALFREHPWFENLVEGIPANQAQAEAARKFLYTWVHEAGHAWNFLHSWDKSRPDALSWMNYDWRYDDRHQDGDFWKSFEFRFEEEELLHLRHGNRAAVIMGGDSWGSGGHLHSDPNDLAAIEIDGGSPPLELLVRSAERFEFLEPVEIELRLRNLMPKKAIMVDGRIDTESGAVAIFIKGPDGSVSQYSPLMCMLADPVPVELQPASKRVQGPDRLSRGLPLSYGGHGFYFDKPGEYFVRAVYQGAGGILIPSNVHRISIGFPTSPDQERLAQDFFTAKVGLSLYLSGSQSPSLTDGMDVLHRLASNNVDQKTGARAAMIIADSLARPFYGLVNKKLKPIHKADPIQALEMSRNAMDVFAQSTSPSVNLPHRRLVEQRYQCWEQIGEMEQGAAEMRAMQTGLAKRGVNQSVLKQIAGREKIKKKNTSRRKK